MNKSRFKPPYKPDGATNFRATVKRSGVYIIKSRATDRILYIGYSATNLYRTMYRHFQSWNDSQQVRVTYRDKNAYLVRVVYATPTQAAKLEKGLIAKYKPKDNPHKIDLSELLKENLKMVEEYERENVRTDIPF